MAGVATSKYAVQQIFVVDAFDLDDGSLITRFEDLKTSTFSNNGTVVYAQGGVGNPKIIGFSHSKESSLAIGSAVITDGALEIQTGENVVTITSSTSAPFDEILTVTTADQVLTTYAATGTTNDEIGFVYILNNDGTIGTTLEQATSATTGKFAYATATKTITFATSGAPVGTRILVIYYPTITDVKQIHNATNAFAKNVRLHAKTLFRDTCTGVDYFGVIIYYKAKASEEYSLDISADGEPAVHNITFEALKACGQETLWDIYIYDSGSITE